MGADPQTVHVPLPPGKHAICLMMMMHFWVYSPGIKPEDLISERSRILLNHKQDIFQEIEKACLNHANSGLFFSSFAAALQCGPAWSRTNLPNISSDDESPDIKIQSLLNGLFQLLLISNFSEIQFHGRRYRKGNHIFTNSWHAWWIWEWERTDGNISYITFKRESHLCSLVKDTRGGGGEES